MSRTLPFLKMHGIGNDFIVVNCLVPEPPTVEGLQAAAKSLCDRRFGVGGDGVILVLPSQTADYQMRMFNPDGSEAEMCGNGIRCFGKFVYDYGYTNKNQITVETLGGIKTLDLIVQDQKVDMVTVDMGCPGLERSDLPMIGKPGSVKEEEISLSGKFESETVAITGVSMGNPHAIFFTDHLTDELINTLGPVLEQHPLFPRRINVHAVRVNSPEEVTMLTWERGAGRTLACGTGACAVVVASAINGKTGRRVLVHLAGGDLMINWRDDNHVYMTGAATEVFSGTINR